MAFSSGKSHGVPLLACPAVQYCRALAISTGQRRDRSKLVTAPVSPRTTDHGPRTAFTLVELLVVITIIGMLVALLIPAVQSARETARSRQCATNMGELAKATVNYETSRGNFPGYAQFVKRGQQKWARVDYDNSTRKFLITTDTATVPEVALSWAAMLLRNVERQDLWDRIVTDDTIPVEVPAMDVFLCPSDNDALAIAGRPALSYNANTGAWDRDDSGDFLWSNDEGDVGHNGVMFNLAAHQLKGSKGPVTRMGAIRDGANMTILYSENIHKQYDDPDTGAPIFSWIAGGPTNINNADGTEQQFGLVWVVNTTPLNPPSGVLQDQEPINRYTDPGTGTIVFDETRPLFARPASAHNNGVNVAFCDAHVTFLRDDIDYIVYQQLLTTNGAKCEDPLDLEPVTSKAGPAIRAFRTASPLSEQDYQ